MSILAVSVSHKTTSVDVLSRVAMDAATATKLAQSLLSGDHVDEAVVLSTCNRTEMYVAVSRFHGGLDDDVPLEVAFRTMRALRSADVQLNVIKGGGHRLSAPHEIEAIVRTVEAVIAHPEEHSS